MAITPVGLTRHLPWRRGSDMPLDLDAALSPGASPTVGEAALGETTFGEAAIHQPAIDEPAIHQSAFEVAATDERGQPGPQRGPNGRFVRRPARGAVPQPAVVAEPAVPAAGPEPAPAFLPADHGQGDNELRAPRPIRIVLVEDVPDVAVQVRELLRWQPRFKVVHVIADGRHAVEEIRDLGPDVVVVDALLQGRTDARTVVEGLRDSGSPVGIVALTVPEHSLDASMSRHSDAVVTMPFGSIDLGRGVIDAHQAATARDPSATSRIVAVFSPKGGVGTTTIAYNLAASLAGTGLRTLLIDGSLQYGDVRRLLQADPNAPSICDLPTDSVRGSDLADTVVRDGCGVDVLLAPPRPELAELVNGRDLEQLLGVLRRAYQAIVIDTPSTLSEPTLAFLDAADLIVNVLTADPATLGVTRLIAATFAEVGYPTAKVRYLVNRHGDVGALSASEVMGALGHEPHYTVAADWPLVASSNAAGVPYVLARPDAAVSAGLRRLTESVRALTVTPAH